MDIQKDSDELSIYHDDVKDSILDVADNYDVFFVDVFGVLYNGSALYKNTLETLKKLKEMGKQIIILSNATQVSEDAKLSFYKKGIEDAYYDEFLTSGEFLKHFLKNHKDEFNGKFDDKATKVKCLFMGNNTVFEGSHVSKVDNCNDADFVYVGVPRASYGAVRVDNVFDENGKHVHIEDIITKDWNKLTDDHGNLGFFEFDHQLRNCLKLGKTLLVANPDIFAYGTLEESNTLYPIVTQGCIGAYYKNIGGNVVFFGKPYDGIFEYAKTFTEPNKRIAMIGDTPWTDVLGANNNNIDSIMVMTGIPSEFFEKMDRQLPLNEKMKILFRDISPKMDCQYKVGVEKFIPKIIIKRFAF